MTKWIQSGAAFIRLVALDESVLRLFLTTRKDHINNNYWMQCPIYQNKNPNCFELISKSTTSPNLISHVINRLSFFSDAEQGLNATHCVRKTSGDQRNFNPGNESSLDSKCDSLFWEYNAGFQAFHAISHWSSTVRHRQKVI